MNFEQFNQLMKSYPLAPARIVHSAM